MSNELNKLNIIVDYLEYDRDLKPTPVYSYIPNRKENRRNRRKQLKKDRKYVE